MRSNIPDHRRLQTKNGEGRLVYQIPDLKLSRDRSREQLAGFHPGIKRSVNPHQYPAGLELGLHELKTDMILQARTAN